MNSLKLNLGVLAAAGVVFAGSAAMAATGTSTAATSMDGVSTAFNDLLNGSGGALIIVIAVLVAAATALARFSMGVIATAFGATMFVGYGFDALTGLAGVSAAIPAYLPFSVDFVAQLPPSI